MYSLSSTIEKNKEAERTFLQPLQVTQPNAVSFAGSLSLLWLSMNIQGL